MKPLSGSNRPQIATRRSLSANGSGLSSTPFDHAEDSNVGADADGHRQRQEQREAGLTPQEPERMAGVLEKAEHRRSFLERAAAPTRHGVERTRQRGMTPLGDAGRGEIDDRTEHEPAPLPEMRRLAPRLGKLLFHLAAVPGPELGRVDRQQQPDDPDRPVVRSSRSRREQLLPPRGLDDLLQSRRFSPRHPATERREPVVAASRLVPLGVARRQEILDQSVCQ